MYERDKKERKIYPFADTAKMKLKESEEVYLCVYSMSLPVFDWNRRLTCFMFLVLVRVCMFACGLTRLYFILVIAHAQEAVKDCHGSEKCFAGGGQWIEKVCGRGQAGFVWIVLR